MSLKSQPEYLAAGAFESDDESATANETTTATTKEQDMTTNTKQTDAGASASVAATTAIARAATTPNALAGYKAPTKLVLAFSDKNGVFDVSTVEGLALAVPRCKAEQGSIFMGEADLGAEIQFEVVSISPRWVIGISEDTKEAKDFFRVSFDGVTISGEGTSVEDYMNDLKAQGFDKANKSPYLDIFGFVVWSEKKGHVAPEARELACIQCSKTSMGAFVAFSTTRGLLESKGIAQPIDVIEIHAEKRTAGANRFTNFSFHAPKAK